MTLVITFLKVSILCFVILRISKNISAVPKVSIFADKTLQRRVNQVFVPLSIEARSHDYPHTHNLIQDIC